MPRYVESETALNYKISFIIDGEFVSPSEAFITITDNAGDVVDSVEDEELTIPANATSVVFSISEEANEKTLDYELRYITVRFVFEDGTYYVRDFYTLRDDVRIPVTLDDVRNLAGLSSSELSDDQIDIFIAYDELQGDVEVNLGTTLDAGSALIPYIIQGVKSKAALDALTTIETTIYQSEQADNTLYKRFANIDFGSILGRLTEIYNNAVMKLNGVNTGEGETVTVFLVATGTDPVTNA